MLSFMAFNVFFCIFIFTVACNAPVTLPSHTAAFASFLHLHLVFLSRLIEGHGQAGFHLKQSVCVCVGGGGGGGGGGNLCN